MGKTECPPILPVAECRETATGLVKKMSTAFSGFAKHVGKEQSYQIFSFARQMEVLVVTHSSQDEEIKE